MQIDQTKLNDFVVKFVGELGAVLHAPTVINGDKLGLYRAMAGAGPLSPQDLALKTNTAERYIREWLDSQAASGYVNYEPVTGKYSLSPEQASALTDETSPAYIPGAYYIAASLFRDEPQITEAFRTGNGVGWHQHDTDLFCGTEKFFRPDYIANLISGWLPALEGVVEKLNIGASVANIGCGHDASTILMARSFPNSRFIGYDYHAPSVVEENLKPIGRIFYSASTMICTPTSLSQDVGAALGAQASEQDLQQVVVVGGFTQFRRAAQTPFNRIFEARP